MKDPYQVLGVSPSATDEEIKDAYRALVKKYHPDKFADSDLAELANEKMKEINSAYDEIEKIRHGGGSQSRSQQGSRGYGAYGGAYGGYNPGGSSKSEFYTRIRQLINTGNIFEAEQMLLSTPVANREGEWNYLYACVMAKKGYYADAQRYFDMACSYDPQNAEYSRARDFFRARSQQNGAYRTYQTSNGCCDMDCCTSLICADCCCECMGGDLIRCC